MQESSSSSVGDPQEAIGGPNGQGWGTGLNFYE